MLISYIRSNIFLSLNIWNSCRRACINVSIHHTFLGRTDPAIPTFMGGWRDQSKKIRNHNLFIYVDNFFLCKYKYNHMKYNSLLILLNYQFANNLIQLIWNKELFDQLYKKLEAFQILNICRCILVFFHSFCGRTNSVILGQRFERDYRFALIRSYVRLSRIFGSNYYYLIISSRQCAT